jgi:hypothetical protein
MKNNQDDRSQAMDRFATLAIDDALADGSATNLIWAAVSPTGLLGALGLLSFTRNVVQWRAPLAVWLDEWRAVTHSVADYIFGWLPRLLNLTLSDLAHDYLAMGLIVGTSNACRFIANKYSEAMDRHNRLCGPDEFGELELFDEDHSIFEHIKDACSMPAKMVWRSKLVEVLIIDKMKILAILIGGIFLWPLTTIVMIANYIFEARYKREFFNVFDGRSAWSGGSVFLASFAWAMIVIVANQALSF